MLRCLRCIIPANYPTSVFDDQGVCNFCRTHRSKEYLGANALKDRILSYSTGGRPSKYDCALGFSGGRDSTYLLYFLSEILKLRVLALTIDNGFVPPESMENVRSITKLLGVDLVTEKYSYLEECFGNHLKAWLRKPEPAMITALCAGCRLGLAKGIYEFQLEHKVPVFMTGGTPFEAGTYKTALLRVPTNGKTKSSLMLGYVQQVIKNPRWVSDPRAVTIQAKDFMAYHDRTYRKKARKRGYAFISPFYRYIRWEETKVVHVLNQLGWRRNSQTGSTWRGDCDIATLKLYLYRTLLGYNDKDDSFSALIRDGQLTREDAMRRLESEQFIAEGVIKSVVETTGASYSYFQQVVDKAQKSG